MRLIRSCVLCSLAVLLVSLAAGCSSMPAPDAASAVAQTGPYLAANVGESVTYDYSVGDPLNQPFTNLDNKDVAFEGLVGYQFSGVLAAEISYVDLGSLTVDGPSFGGFTDELKVHGFNFGAVGTYPPLTPFAGQLRTGAFAWTQDIDYHDPGEDYVQSESGVGVSAGAGLRYRIPGASGFGVMADWTRYFNVGDNDKSGHRYDRDFFSFGVGYTFGHATQ